MGNQSLSWLFESVSPSHQNPVVLAEVCGLLPCQTRGAALGGAGGRGGWLVAGGWCSGRGGSAGGPGGHLCLPAPAVSLCHLGFCVCACWHRHVSCPAAVELLGSAMGDRAGKICGESLRERQRSSRALQGQPLRVPTLATPPGCELGKTPCLQPPDATEPLECPQWDLRALAAPVVFPTARGMGQPHSCSPVAPGDTCGVLAMRSGCSQQPDTFWVQWIIWVLFAFCCRLELVVQGVRCAGCCAGCLVGSLLLPRHSSKHLLSEIFLLGPKSLFC